MDISPEIKQRIIDMLMADCNTLAQKKSKLEMIGEVFKWPSIDEQIIKHGEKRPVKRGRAIYGRDMYYIPGFEVEGHKPFPGFVCHPSAAVAAAVELLRLAKEDGLIDD